MLFTSTKILLAKSPQFITYESALNYSYLKVHLYVWNGLVADIPSFPTHTYTLFRNPNKTIAYLNIQPAIAELLNPKPNSSYFTDHPSDFGEFTNLKYVIDVWRRESDGTMELKDTVESDLMYATLGYGRHAEGANPFLIPLKVAGVVTIDSTLITIDSTLITIDSDGKNKLFDNKYKFFPPNSRVFDGIFNQSDTDSRDIIKRELVTDHKVSCPGKYEPKDIMYMNKNGLFEVFSFTKASSQSVKSISEISNRLSSTPYNYNIADHNQKITKTGTVKWTLNTDNLTQINGEYLTDLFFSDIYYMIDYDNETFIPMVLSSTDFSPKTDKVDRAKQQYTFTFEESNEYIQKIR